MMVERHHRDCRHKLTPKSRRDRWKELGGTYVYSAAEEEEGLVTSNFLQLYQYMHVQHIDGVWLPGG